MCNNKAITAGVRIGGLNDRTEIKILLCYLLSAVQAPLTQQQLIDSVVGQELVNYFELQDALQRLVDHNLVVEQDGTYSILPEGIEIAHQLEKSLPFSVKERAYNTAIQLLQYQKLKRQNKTAITPLKKGGYNLKCTIEDAEFVMFSVEVVMPDEKTARLAQEKFILHGQDIFKCVLGVATENPKMYYDFLKSQEDAQKEEEQ